MKPTAPSAGMLCCALFCLQWFAPAPLVSQEYQREVDRIAEEVSETASKAGLKNVAVLDFTDLQGNVRELGRFMAEELTTSLVLKDRPFKTIDRANLRSILLESKLSMSGLVSPENAKKLKISGVDGLIRGSLTPFGESIRLTIQVIAVDTAQIVGAARGVVPKTAAMDNLGDALDSSTSLGAESPSMPNPGKPGLFFQDSSLRITLTFFRKSAGNSIKAIFKIENLTKQVLRVVWPRPQLVDDQGEQWRLAERSGIDDNIYTEISGGTNLTALLVFKPETSGSQATRFNVIGPIGVYDESNHNFSFFPNIQNVSLGI